MDLRKKWTKEEDKILIDSYQKSESAKTLADKYNVTEIAVKKRIYRILNTEHKKLNSKDIQYILDNYKTKKNKEIADYLGVCDQTISNHLHKLGIKKFHVPHLTEETALYAVELIKQGKLLKELPPILKMKYGQMMNMFLKYNITPTDFYTPEMKVRHKIVKDAGFTSIYTTYRRNAQATNTIFQLTKEELITIVVQDCYYCGESPSKETRNKSHLTKIKYNGIDKKNPKNGYILDNCVPCCWECNRIKSDIPYEKFLMKLKKINDRLKL